MQFGLKTEVIEAIQQVLEQNPRVDKALVFGSRAKGNYKEGSDIDLALKGDITAKDLLELHGKLEALNLPYSFDLVNYSTINEPALKEHIDGVGVEMYSRWREYKIGDIISLEYGKSLTGYQNSKGEYDVFGTNGKIGTANEYLYDKPSLIIGRKGAYRGVHLSNRPFFVIDTAFYTRNKAEYLNTLFLYYWFKTIDINSMDTGSAIPSTSRDDVYNLDITLPPLSEQIRISELLGALDNKIDLLHRHNKTLEQLAEALFRQWFVEEADESWKATTLEKHTELFRGLSYKGNGLVDLGNGLPMHNLNSIYEFGGYKRDGIKYYKGEYKERQLVNAGDIIIANTEQGHEHRLIGFPGIVPNSFGKRGLFSQHIYRLLPLKSTFLTNQFIYYLLMTPSMREQIIGATNGSTVNMLAIDGLQRPEFKLPPKQKVKEFSAIILDYWKKKESNYNQIQTLKRLRDILLPKLMNGEVRVDFENSEFSMTISGKKINIKQ